MLLGTQAKKRPGRFTFPAACAISLFASRQSLAVDAGCFFEQLAVGVAQPAVGHDGIGLALRAQDKEARL